LSLLTAAKPHLRPCPYLGRYIVTGLSQGRHFRPSGGTSVVSDTETSVTQCNDLQFQSLTVGCSEVNTMQFHSSCNVAETSSKFSQPLFIFSARWAILLWGQLHSSHFRKLCQKMPKLLSGHLILPSEQMHGLCVPEEECFCLSFQYYLLDYLLTEELHNSKVI
jgi:hypothetical protein